MADIKIDNATILTLNPTRDIILNGSILIENNIIIGIGPRNDLLQETADKVINANGKLAVPGFFNNHIHISYAHAVRGIFPDGLSFSKYLNQVFQLQSEMSAEEEYYTSLLGIIDMIKNGTTSFFEPGSVKHIPSLIKAIEKSGCRSIIGTSVVDTDNPINLPVLNTDEALSLMERTLSQYHNSISGRVRVWIMPYSINYSSKDLLIGSKLLSQTYNTGISLHSSQNEEQSRITEKKTGKSPVEYLQDLNLLGNDLLLSHMVSVSDVELDLLSSTNTNVVHLPSAALKMASGVTQIGKFPEMVDKKICLCLGTDAANNSNHMDILRSANIVASIYKDTKQNSSIMSPETCLEMLTINGAKSLSMNKYLGSIEIGKKADIVLFDTLRPEWRSLFNPDNNLIYSADGRSISEVIIDGRIIIEDGDFIDVDELELITKVQNIGEDLLSRSDIEPSFAWPLI